jgi:hypothetical protein
MHVFSTSFNPLPSLSDTFCSKISIHLFIYLFIYSFTSINHGVIFVLLFYFIIKYKYTNVVVYQHEFKHWFFKYKLFYYYNIDIAVGHFKILKFCQIFKVNSFLFLKTVNIIFWGHNNIFIWPCSNIRGHKCDPCDPSLRHCSMINKNI